MNKQWIRYIIFLMSISLVGLIFIQFYWISNDLKLQERQFDENVKSAMRSVVKTLEKRIAANSLASQIIDSTKTSSQPLLAADEYRVLQDEKRTNIKQDSLTTRTSRYQKKILVKEYKNEKHRKEFKIEESERQVFFWNKDLKYPEQGMNGKYAPFAENKDVLKSFFDSIEKALNKAEIIKGLVMDFSIGNKSSLELINPSSLDTLLRKELKSMGVDTRFSYGLRSQKTGKMIFVSDTSSTKKIENSDYRISLFSNDFFENNDVLTLHFPSKGNYLFKQMAFVLSLSAGLVLLIIFSFIYTITSILKQKKISEMKTDFINNMTHEFKTPVSTILLASEALKDPAIAGDSARLQRLAGVIYEENNRMGKQVERVLQIAAMEKEDFKLQISSVNIHDLINRVVEGSYLQIENRSGSIQKHLNAGSPILPLDELHVSNVIYNLLDNAIKYSFEKPEISISTMDTDNGILLIVEDKGLGMTLDEQKNIFEKFYRVPTGNLHNVKGFGLGLSYVKKIVEMLNGTINVKSAIGKGSRFEIFLPH